MKLILVFSRAKKNNSERRHVHNVMMMRGFCNHTRDRSWMNESCDSRGYCGKRFLELRSLVLVTRMFPARVDRKLRQIMTREICRKTFIFVLSWFGRLFFPRLAFAPSLPGLHFILRLAVYFPLSCWDCWVLCYH